MLAEKPPISIAVCTVHHGLPVERTMAYPISVGAFTFDHGKHPWWPQGSQKTPGNFEEKKEFCRDSMVNGPAPRFVVDLGRLCFILVLFDAENQVYLILLAVFLLDMELKPKKTWTKFSTYDKSSLKACHLLRKNKLVLVTMHEINMQRCCFMANCMAQATQSHLLSQPPYHAVFGPMKGALVCGNQLRQLKIHENPL